VTRILIVDDDPDIRSFVMEALLDEGYDVLVAPDGQVALQFAQEHPPDLILLDFQMPQCDAHCFMAGYRSLTGAHAKVVMVTAATSARQRAAAVGANDYLPKPFDLTDLYRVVEKHAA
jgi:DNA-binding response OmpR family regulator